jgi:hypothetical protein
MEAKPSPEEEDFYSGVLMTHAHANSLNEPINLTHQ